MKRVASKVKTSNNAIEHIVNMRPYEMDNEQEAVYAQNYGIEVEQIDLHWISMHEKRVRYAQEYVDDVTIDDTPSEVLEKLNQIRMRKLTALNELDEKANNFANSGGNYRPYTDDRARCYMLQVMNAAFSEFDIPEERNSRS